MSPAALRCPVSLRIAATGRYLPPRVVTSEEIDARTGMPCGWTRAHTGILERRYAEELTAAHMGERALRAALGAVDWGERPPDLLISGAGTPQQPIPCNAALVASAMGWRGVACFDVNATCLGFVAALQVAAGLIASGAYARIAIVCSEIASSGLNWKEPESAGLMGDGAAAVLLESCADGSGAFLGSVLETSPEGANLTEIRGGGTALHATAHRPGENTEEYLFHMNGPAVFRLASAKIEPFVARLIGTGERRWESIDWVVPHQASLPALLHIRRRLRIPAAKFVENIGRMGNVIAASIPLTLHELILSGRLQRGQTILFLGSSAGFSLGAALIRY
ncbi:MAG: 3-oxoacyl-[acyl-carrier-protein] synthase-3 [Verrucomicrobia bacterium]|jgi:3-oxoacyl-[acyl-carrier-protein] synthase-3|nr:MAG: 3-oxoacyl-[acyl-carrier-protein] synthase-3 [Verrucomicrobiota bacterium]